MPQNTLEFWKALAKLRTSVGIMLLAPGSFSGAEEIAARTGADSVDFRQIIRSAGLIAQGSNLIDFRPDTIFKAIRYAQSQCSKPRVVILNFDLAIAALKISDRALVWSSLMDNYPANSNTCMAIAMPKAETGLHLLPPNELLTQWLQSGQAFQLVE
jgi:hypothetical protein